LNAALDPQRSVSVAASAGSGKTWQLVSRIVRLLLAGVEPGRILALTFTRKAASEMRERVEARLRELAYADSSTLDLLLRELNLTPDAALHARARALYEPLLFAPFGLRAQTLHAFCQDVLTRFAVEAEVPAGFSLIEDEQEVLTRALDRLLAQIQRQPESLEAQALDVLIATGASESAIRGWIVGFAERRSDWWAYSEVWRTDGEDPAAAASTALALELDLDPDADAPETAFDAPSFSQNLQALHDLLLEFKGLGHLNAALLAPALIAVDAQTRGHAAAKLLTATGERRSLKQKKGVTDAAYARFIECYEMLCGVLEAVREQTLRRETWRRSAAAFRLGSALLAQLETVLQAAQALTFADLEWRTYRLLRDPERADWVRYKLDQRLDHLLLDEFQDTNPTQWSLLLPLLDEMAAGDPERNRTAFIVGDTKQSIYSFRRANPELMATAAAYVGTAFNGEAMPLNDSRRSAPAIIDFVNALFAGADGVAIDFQTHGTWRREDWGAVEIAPLVRALPAETVAETAGLRNPLTTPRLIAEDLRARTEAQQIAARIAALVAAELSVADSGGARGLRYGDVMILARQRTHLHLIEQALAARNIPFSGASRGTLLETVLARDLLALLRFLDAPHRDLELAQTLRSPLFDASDDDLLTLARASGGSWWQRLQTLAVAADVSTPLAEAAAQIGAWLTAARTLPAHDLLDRIGFETALIARYEAALPGDTRVRANFGAFLQLLLDTDQGRYPTLGRINHHLAQRANAATNAPDEAPPPGDDAVRVMTIHASKGLEAPAVFLVNSAPSPRNRNDGWLIEWPSGDERPSRFLLAGRAEQRDALSRTLVDNQRQRDARETLNLLYVAVTRARQYLFISAFESGKKSAGGELSWHARCLAAMTTLAAEAALPGAPADTLGYRRGVVPDGVVHRVASPATAIDDPRLRRPLTASTPSKRLPSGEDATRDADDAVRGRAIHWLLQQLAEDRLGDPEKLAARINAVLATSIDETQLPLWLADARTTYAAPQLAAFFQPQHYRRAWNEAPVQWLDDGELRSGVIDRLVDDGSTLWILDYKTAPRPNIEILSARHRPQLEAYADAVAALWPGRAIHAGLVLTASAQWHSVLQR